jgi:hypothetical protein
MQTLTNTRKAVVAAAFALALAACSGSALSTNVPSIAVPTLPPDLASAAAGACVDAPTMAIIGQLRATGADAPALLEANKDALIAGLGRLESDDATTMTWRDALVDALEAGDFDKAADEIARLANDEVTLTPC